MTSIQNDINRKIGLKVKLERTRLGVTQEKLAELADLNKNSVGAIERGESSPTIETLDRLAKAFNIQLHELTNVSQMNL